MNSLVPRAACPGTGCDKEIQEDKGQVSKLEKQRTVGNPLGAAPAFHGAWAARQAQGEDLHFRQRLDGLILCPGQLYIKLCNKY